MAHLFFSDNAQNFRGSPDDRLSGYWSREVVNWKFLPPRTRDKIESG